MPDATVCVFTFQVKVGAAPDRLGSAVNIACSPGQMVSLLPNMVTNGTGLSATRTLSGADIQLLAVAVNLYHPVSLYCRLLRCGLRVLAVKPFGPVQL